MPTGHLLEVYYDHADKIYEECEATISKPFTTYPACPSVAKASWCAVSVGSMRIAPAIEHGHFGAGCCT